MAYLVLSSRIFEHEDDSEEVDKKINFLFPYNIEIRPLKDETHLTNWKTQLKEDMKMNQFQDNKNHIAEFVPWIKCILGWKEWLQGLPQNGGKY
ncbi:hypothetical protein BC332_24068 [Capsicum chinense]|nr:hypothetical protein BC332_24068 [Capsicum chinense]